MWLPLQLLSATCWSLVNIFDSSLVRHYEKRATILQWHQCLFTLSTLVILGLLFPVQTEWALPLFAVGTVSYFGDRALFLVLDRVDVSVTHIAWALLTVYLSIGGMILFGESWSLMQTAGVALVLSGICLLSLWGKHVGSLQNFLLLMFFPLLYVPFYLLQKHVVVLGVGVFVSFFWLILGREIPCVILPFLRPHLRRGAFDAFKKHGVPFVVLNAIVILFFFAGTLLTAKAYETGPISLVSIISNIQPFLVVFSAWILWKFLPKIASRELLTAQSVGVKIVSFAVVFAGLALLAIPQ